MNGKIAIATEAYYDEYDSKEKKTFHDDAHLAAALRRDKGYEVDVINWRKDGVDWTQYDSIFVSSTWDIPQYYREFEEWMDQCESDNVKRLINDRVVIDACIHKNRYLTMLRDDIGESISNPDGFITPSRFFSRVDNQDKTVQVIPEGKTLQEVLQEIDDDLQFQEKDLVIKPLTSSDGHETFIYERSLKQSIEEIPTQQSDHITNSYSEANDRFQKILNEPDLNGVIIQPYIRTIEETGEYSLVFFGTKFSHAVQKKPGFRNSTSSSQRELVEKLPEGIQDFATHVMEKLHNRFEDGGITRARVDVVGGQKQADGRFNWGICEVELAEPNCNILCFSYKAGDLLKEPGTTIDEVQEILEQRNKIVGRFADVVAKRTKVLRTKNEGHLSDVLDHQNQSVPETSISENDSTDANIVEKDSNNEDDSYVEHGESSSATGKIVVSGAGVDAINGIYNYSGVFENAVRYSKNGIWQDRNETFSLFRCRLSDHTRRWYISIVPKNIQPGTKKDTDFYFTTATVTGDQSELPDNHNWVTVENNGINPPPNVTFK